MAAREASGAGNARPEGRGVVPLAVCYLVVHCVGTAVVLALLAASTLVYMGAGDVSGELVETVSVLGLEVSARALLVIFWVAGGAVSVAGVAFGALALLSRARPRRLGTAMLLGRVMFALSVANVVLSFLQAAPVSVLTGLVTATLTGALSLELRRYEDALRESGASVSTPRRSFVVDAAETVPRLEEVCDDRDRGLFRLCSGYASIMLAWGALRVVMGLSTLASAPSLSSYTGRVSTAVFGGLVICAGVLLVFVGRTGKRALVGASSLLALVGLSATGLALSLVALVVYAVWQAIGWTADGLLVFSTLADCLLYAAGIYYANKLRKGFGKKF